MSCPSWLEPSGLNYGRLGAFSTVVLDAAGEYVDLFGQIQWEDGADHDFTAAGGGEIRWCGGNHTWANAGTNLRIGIQDPDLTAAPPVRGDGTYNVQADWVPGTDSLPDNSTHTIPMESGGESPLPHGALRVVRLELTARGGADSVVVNSGGMHSQQSWCSVTSAIPTPTTASNQQPNVLFIADDGTVGWFAGTAFHESASSQSFDSGSTPDEYGLLVRFPYRLRIWGFDPTGFMSAITGAAIEFHLYRDPLGSPSSVRSRSYDPSATCTSSSATYQTPILFSSPYVMPAGEDFLVAVRPTDTTSDWQIQLCGIPSAEAKKCWRFLDGLWRIATRSNNSGAFTEDLDTIIPMGLLAEIIGPSRKAGMMVGVM